MANTGGNNQRPHYEPTAAEIAAECERIREGWSVHEWKRARRRYGASIPSPQGSYRMFVEEGE